MNRPLPSFEVQLHTDEKCGFECESAVQKVETMILDVECVMLNIAQDSGRKSADVRCKKCDLGCRATRQKCTHIHHYTFTVAN